MYFIIIITYNGDGNDGEECIDVYELLFFFLLLVLLLLSMLLLLLLLLLLF